MKKLRILLTGGGTGGHIYPLIAVAGELKKQAQQAGLEIDLRYFGPAKSYRDKIEASGMKFYPMLSSKFRRYWSALNFLDAPKFFISLIQMLWRIFWFMPDAVFSKGGPGALAVVLVSRFYRIPVLIHESDSAPGLTNRISGRFSKKVFLAIETAADYFNKKNIEVVGNPVREALLAKIPSENDLPQMQKVAKLNFGFSADEPLVLVLGGSQGAERINNFILENLELLIRHTQILHQVGGSNFESYSQEFQFITKDWSPIEKKRYAFQPFFKDNLAEAMIAADIIISRAGAGSIFEIAAFGKPAILIPLPEAAYDHQLENARAYSKNKAAMVILQKNLLGNLMSEELKKLLADQPLLQAMGRAAKEFYRPDSGAIIAKQLLEEARR